MVKVEVNVLCRSGGLSSIILFGFQQIVFHYVFMVFTLLGNLFNISICSVVEVSGSEVFF